MHHKNEVSKIIHEGIAGTGIEIDVAKIHQLMDDYAEDQKSLPLKINIKNPNTGSEINGVTIKEFIHILHNPLEDESIGGQFLYDYDDVIYTIENKL